MTEVMSPKTIKIRVKKSSTYKEVLKELIVDESEKIKRNEVVRDGDEVLSHLGNYIEEPYNIIESYFEGKHLERLVRHQLESYNHFINYQVQRTIQMFNPVIIHS